MPSWVDRLNKTGSRQQSYSGGSSGVSWVDRVNKSSVETVKRRTLKEEQRRKEEMIQQAQQDAKDINYAQEAYKGKGLIGGALSWINRVTGRGTAMPTLVNETPEYTEQRKSSEAEVNKGFGTRFKEATIGSATESAYDIFFQKKVDDVNLKVIEENNKRLADLVKKNKAETDNGRKAIRDKAIKNVVDLNKNLASEVGGELKDKDFLQLVGQSIGTALDLTPFLGFSTFGTQAVKFVGKNLLKQGVKTFTKESIKQIAKESAKLSSKQVLKQGVAEAGLYGAMSGLGGGLEQKDRTVGSVVKSTVIGGGIGAGLGLGVGLLGKYAGKLFIKRATKEAEKILINNIEKKLGKLDPDESSIIKEAIKDGASEVDIVKQIQDARDLFSGPKTPKVEATNKNTIFRGQPAENKFRQSVSNVDASNNILIGKGVFATDSEKMARTYGSNVRAFERPTKGVLDISNATDADLEKLGVDKETARIYKDTLASKPPETIIGQKVDYQGGKYKIGNIFNVEGELKYELSSTTYGEPSKYVSKSEAEKLWKPKPNLSNVKDAEDILMNNIIERFTGGKSIEELLNGGASEAGKLKSAKEQASKWLNKQGYDFVKHQGGIRAGGGNELHDVYIALSDEALKPKTKSQLTKIWNKANKEIPKTEIPTEPKTESPILKKVNTYLDEASKLDEELPTTSFRKEFSSVEKRIEADPKKAYNDFVYGTKESDVTRSAGLILLLENAKSKGDMNAISEIGMAAARHGRKSGQEVVMFRSLYEADPMNKLLIDFANTKLHNVESRYPKFLKKLIKGEEGDIITATTKAIKKRTVSFKDAQDIINSFICK